MEDLQHELEEAVKRRDRVHSQVQRAKGRLESAKKALEDVLQECRDHDLDPDQLDQLVQALGKSLREHLQDLKMKLDQAEDTLTPFLETHSE